MKTKAIEFNAEDFLCSVEAIRSHLSHDANEMSAYALWAAARQLSFGSRKKVGARGETRTRMLLGTGF